MSLYTQPTKALAERCRMHSAPEHKFSQAARVLGSAVAAADSWAGDLCVELAADVLCLLAAERGVTWAGWRQSLHVVVPADDKCERVRTYAALVESAPDSKERAIRLELLYAELARLYTTVLQPGDDLTREIELMLDEHESLAAAQ
jgi:hypothetical protein